MCQTHKVHTVTPLTSQMGKLRHSETGWFPKSILHSSRITIGSRWAAVCPTISLIVHCKETQEVEMVLVRLYPDDESKMQRDHSLALL